MFVVRILERKSVIRLFGIGLILSPIANIVFKIFLLSNLRDRWNLSFALKVFETNSFSVKALFLCSVVIGALMLRGASSAWKYTLVLMGCHIANQIVNFGPNFRASPYFAVFFLVNVAIFLFIADQLVWKVKMATPAHKRLVPINKKTEKKVEIYFAGFGPWARLTSVSSRGIHMRSVKTLPFELKHREIEVQITSDLVLRTRLARCLDDDYFFEYVNMSPAEADKLNHWLRTQVQAA